MGWVEDDLIRYEREQAKAEKEYPICSICGERIMSDHAYDFGEVGLMCEDCKDEYVSSCAVDIATLFF